MVLLRLLGLARVPRCQLDLAGHAVFRTGSCPDCSPARLRNSASGGGTGGCMVTAVVVTYNSAACVGHCLASLLEHLPDAEIVVVDNASADHTGQVVATVAPTARFLSLEENIGFGQACNLG